MGRAGPEGNPGALEPQAAELRRVPPGRQRGRRPEKGGAPRRRGDRTERDFVERLGRRGQGGGVGAGPDGWPGAVQRGLAGPGSRGRVLAPHHVEAQHALRARQRPPPMPPASVDRSRPAGRPSLAQRPVPDHRDALPWPRRQPSIEGAARRPGALRRPPTPPAVAPPDPTKSPLPAPDGASTASREARYRGRSRDTLGRPWRQLPNAGCARLTLPKSQLLTPRICPHSVAGGLPAVAMVFALDRGPY
jgi:hypothetical protein